MPRTYMPSDAKAKITPLHRAIYLMGGAGNLAKAIGVAPATVSHWVNKRNGVPSNFNYCVRIEEATQGKVKAEELAPYMRAQE